MNFSIQHLIKVFREAIDQYHIVDEVNQEFVNPYAGKPEEIYFHKCWIDTVQWHYEDIIRDPEIDPIEGMKLKRMIDSSNQNISCSCSSRLSILLSVYNFVA